MKARLIDRWDRLRASYWFVPALMTLAAALAAVLAVRADASLPRGALDGAWFIYESDVEGARTVLLAVAGTAVGLLGTVFTLTVVPLTIAAAQLGPRLLRNFMRDVGTQVTLGVFCATFVYAALVLLELPPAGGDAPQLAVTGSPLLLLASVAVLIYFIHHLAVSVQATNVVREVGEELEATIRAAYAAAGDAPDAAGVGELRALLEREGEPVAGSGTGYVRAVDHGSLLRLAEERDVALLLGHGAGAFLAAGEPVALAWPPGRLADDGAAALGAAFVLGEQRTFVQDVEFGINSLV